MFKVLSKDKLKGTSLILVFLLLFNMIGPYVPLPGGASAGVPVAEASETITIGELNIGDRVVDESWTWPNDQHARTWTWIVVAKDHYYDPETTGQVEGGAGHVTLFLEGEGLLHDWFDMGQIDGERENYVELYDDLNHWGWTGARFGSTWGVRKFLNGSSYIGGDTGTYTSSWAPAFYDAMSASFRDAILETQLIGLEKATIDDIDTLPYYYTNDKIFLPSLTELGYPEDLDMPYPQNRYIGIIGSQWSYFSNAYSTSFKWALDPENPPDDYTRPSYYYTRSPAHDYKPFPRRNGIYTATDEIVEDGVRYFFTNSIPYNNSWIRPAINIKSDTLIKTAQNPDGAYRFHIPETATVTDISPGETLTEASLNGAQIEVTLERTEYVNTLNKNEFTIHNAPTGTTVSSVTRNSSTVATVTLAYEDYGTMTDNINNFGITISSSQHIEAGNITTDNMTISMMTNAQAVEAAIEALEIGYGDGDSDLSVTDNLTLIESGLRGTTVKWSSPNADVINISAGTGNVLQPFHGGDVTVNLVATISRGYVSGGETEEDTKEFSLTVKMREDVDILLENILPSKIHIHDEKKIFVTGKGFRAFVDKSKFEFMVKKGTWQQQIDSKDIIIQSDQVIVLTVPVPDDIHSREGFYNLILNHDDFNNITITDAFEITDDSKYKARNIEELVITTDNSDVEINNLIIRGSFAEETLTPGRFKLKDPDQVVTFNSFLYFKGQTLTVDTREGQASVTGSGRLYINTPHQPNVTVYDGQFNLSAEDMVFNLPGIPLLTDYLGLKMPVEVRSLVFTGHGLKMNGAMLAGFKIGDKQVGGLGGLDGFWFNEQGYHVKAKVDIDAPFNVGPFDSPRLQVGIDTTIPEYSFGAGATIPKLSKDYGFDLDFIIREGKLDYVTFLVRKEILIPSMGMKFTKLGGGIENISNNSEEPLTILAKGSMSDYVFPTIKNVNFLQLPDMTAGLSQYHLKASTDAKIYGVLKVGEGDFVLVWDPAKHPKYDKAGFELNGEINVLEILIGDLLMKYWEGERIRGTSTVNVNIPSYVPVVGGNKLRDITMAFDHVGAKASTNVLGLELLIDYNYRTDKVTFAIDWFKTIGNLVGFFTDVYGVMAYVADEVAKAFIEGYSAVADLTSGMVKDIVDSTQENVKKALDEAEKALGYPIQAGIDVGNYIVTGAEKAASAVGGVISDGWDTVSGLFCEEGREAILVDIDYTFNALIEVRGMVSDDIRIQAPDYYAEFKNDKENATRYYQSHEKEELRLTHYNAETGEGNLLYLPDENKVYVVLELDQIGYWTFIDWGWLGAYPDAEIREDVLSYASVDIYELPPGVNMDYVAENVIDFAGFNTEIDFPETGRFMLEVTSDSKNVSIYTPMGGKYPLEFNRNSENWNAVYFEDIKKVYAIIDVQEKEGWEIVADGYNKVKAFEVTGSNQEELTALFIAGNRTPLEITETGTIVMEIRGGTRENRLFKADGDELPLVFDEGESGWNAIYLSGYDSIYVLVNVEEAGTWHITHQDLVEVVSYDVDPGLTMPALLQQIESLDSEVITTFDLSHEGRILLKVKGTDSNIRIFNSETIQVVPAEILEINEFGEDYVYFLLDVGSEETGTWEVRTSTPVVVERHYISFIDGELTLEEIIAEFKDIKEAGLLPVEINNIGRLVAEVEFLVEEGFDFAAIQEQIKVISPLGDELELNYDEESAVWNAYYHEAGHKLFIMMDALETGVWNFIVPYGEFLSISRVYGDAAEAMTNIKKVAEGEGKYQHFVNFDKAGAYLLEIKGGDLSTEIFKPHQTEPMAYQTYLLNEENSRQIGDVLYVLVRVEAGEGEKWKIESGGEFTLGFSTIDENGHPLTNISQLLEPADGFRTAMEFSAGSRWSLIIDNVNIDDINNAGEKISLFRPDGSEYVLEFLPPEAGDGFNSEEYANFNAAYEADTKRVILTFEVDQTGEWSLHTSDIAYVETMQLNPAPRVEKFDFKAVAGEDTENLYEVEWEIADPRAGTMVTVSLVSKAALEEEDLLGIELASDLPSTGKVEVKVPEELIPGKYYFVIRAENSETGPLLKGHEEYIEVEYADSPPTPVNLRLDSASNGEIALLFDDVNFQNVSRYMVMTHISGMEGNSNVMLFSGPTLDVSPGEGVGGGYGQRAVLSGLEADNTYLLSVLAIREEGDLEDEEGFASYVSAPSQVVEVYLPEPVWPEFSFIMEVEEPYQATEIINQIPFVYLDYDESGELDEDGNYKVVEKTSYIEEKSTLINHTEATIEISVTNGQDCSFELYLNGELQETILGPARAASFNLTGLSEGIHHIEVIVINDAGDRKVYGESIIVDITDPYLGILAPLNGEAVYGDKVTVMGLTEFNAAMTINGSSVDVDEEDGSFSHDISLTAGEIEEIEIVVFDRSGNKTEAFMQVMAMETGYFQQNNANLVFLEIDEGDLNPDFHPEVYDYSAQVAGGVSTIKLIAGSYSPLATVKVNGSTVNSGSEQNIPLSYGENIVKVKVISEDESVEMEYTITIFRDDPTNPIVVTQITATSVKAGEVLAQSTLSGTFKDAADDLVVEGTLAWADSTVVVTSTGNYDWIFTPTNTASYNVITGNVNVVATVDPVSATLEATSVKAGETLALSALSGTFKDPANSAIKVTGTLVWTDSGTVVTATGDYGWTFTPDSLAVYNVITGTVTVVATVDPIISATPVAATSLKAGETLSQSTLSCIFKDAANNAIEVTGTLAWTDPAEVVNATGDYSWTFTPDNTAIYHVITGTVRVVATVDPLVATQVTATSVKAGEELFASTLKGTFKDPADGSLEVTGSLAWTNQAAVVNATGDYSWTFTPDNTAIYNVIMGTVMVVATVDPVVVAPVTATSVKAGEALSASTLNGTFKDPADGSVEVTGTLAWTNPATVVNSTGEYSWTFTPDNTGVYNVITGTVEVVANTVNPVVAAPVVATSVKAGQTLASSTLSGTFKDPDDDSPVTGTLVWIAPATVVNATGEYSWTFTPHDTAVYNVITGTVRVVATANPVINIPVAASPLEKGETLASSTLSGAFKDAADDTMEVTGTLAWINPTTVVNATGNYSWTFAPDDTATYNVVTGTVEVFAKVRVITASITGTGQIGQTFTGEANAGATNLSYLWLAADEPEGTYQVLSGETGETLLLTEDLAGKFIRVIIRGDYGSDATNAILVQATYFAFNRDTGTITGYNAAGGLDVVIPSKIAGVHVTRIGSNAFVYKFLTSVIIPDSVESIGSHAFEYNQLSSVAIGKNVESIGYMAFYDNNLTSIVIPESVRNIGNYAFIENNITRITIGSNVYVPDDMLEWYDDKFPDAYRAEGSTEGSYEVTGTDGWARDWEKVTFREFFTFDSETKTITDYNAEGGLGVIIPSKIDGVDVENISEDAFKGKSLTSIRIHGSIKFIGSESFQGNNLTEIRIGSDVTIGDNLLNSDDNNFRDEYYPEKLFGTYTGTQTGAWERKLYFTFDPATGTITDYDVRGGPVVVIPSKIDNVDVTGIGNFALRGKYLTTVIMPDSVENIGNWAFNDNNISSLTIGNGLRSIGEGAFSGNALTKVTIPDSVENLGNYAFSSNSLTNITIGSGVKSIGDNAFFFNHLSTLVIPANVEFVGKSAFEYNPLTRITIGSNVDIDDRMLTWQNHFRNAYEGEDKSAGTYVGSQYGPWERKSDGPEAPPLPTVVSKTYTSVTLEEITGAEYNVNGGSWQDNPEFTGLTFGTTYLFRARIKETDAHLASEASAPRSVTTLTPIYTVIFNSNEGSQVEKQEVEHGTAALGPADPARENYTFAGWYADEELTDAYDFSTPVTEGITLYARWAINTYTVTFKDHDGTVLKTETVEHGSGTTAPDNPERDGYTFTGWEKAFDNVTRDLTITAQYNIEEYTVTFKDHDGTELKAETVEHGSSATAPSDPLRVGYTFIGWDKAFDNITEDLTVTAQYSINQYTVIFNSNGGSSVSGQNLCYGSLVAEPLGPTRENYTFAGWYADEELTDAYDFNTPVPGSITLYACWTLQLLPLVSDNLITFLRNKFPGIFIDTKFSGVINQGQVSAPANYTSPGGKDLIFALSWAGSELKLSVYNPNGQLYSEVSNSSPPIAIEVKDAPAGEWSFTITGVDVPNEDYEYAVMIGQRTVSEIKPNPEGQSDLELNPEPKTEPTPVPEPEQDPVLEPVSELEPKPESEPSNDSEDESTIRAENIKVLILFGFLLILCLLLLFHKNLSEKLSSRIFNRTNKH